MYIERLYCRRVIPEELHGPNDWEFVCGVLNPCNERTDSGHLRGCGAAEDVHVPGERELTSESVSPRRAFEQW